MNIIDMIIIAIICFSMIRGIFRGISSEISSIIAVAGGFYGAYLFHPQLADRLPRPAALAQYSEIIAFALIFCAVFVAVSLLGVLIKYALDITMLGWFDRLLGAGFGALKGALAVSVLLFFLVAVTGHTPTGVKQSLLGDYAVKITQYMTRAMSQKNYQAVQFKFEELQQIWEKQKP